MAAKPEIAVAIDAENEKFVKRRTSKRLSRTQPGAEVLPPKPDISLGLQKSAGGLREEFPGLRAQSGIDRELPLRNSQKNVPQRRDVAERGSSSKRRGERRRE